MTAYTPVPYSPSVHRPRPRASFSNARPRIIPAPSRNSFHPKQILAESTVAEKRCFAGLAVLVGALILWLLIGPAVLKHNARAREAKLNMSLAEADGSGSSSSSVFSSLSSTPTRSSTSSTGRPPMSFTLAPTTQISAATSGALANTLVPNPSATLSTHPWAPLQGIFASSSQPPAPSRRINRPTTKRFEPPRPTVRAPWAKVGPMMRAVESARAASHAAAVTRGVWIPDGKIKYADPIVANTTRQAAPRVNLLARRWKSRRGS